MGVFFLKDDRLRMTQPSPTGSLMKKGDKHAKRTAKTRKQLNTERDHPETAGG
jgi:hypothetical protein